MTLIGLIISLVIVGLILWLINTLLPIDPKIKTIINVIVLIVVCLWLLQVFGVLGGNDILNTRIGR
jgi:hypothetical protein